MSVIINFRWEIKPEKHTEFLNLMGQAVTVTKIFDACRWMYVTNGEEDAESNKTDFVVRVVGCWDSIEEYKKYFQWREELGLHDLANEYATSPPVLTFLPVLFDCTK